MPNLSAEELRSLKTQYNKAKEVLEKINALTIRYDAAYRAYETRNIDVEKISNEAREKSLAIEKSKVESENFIKEIRENLEKIELSIKQIEEASVEFEGIKGRIGGKEGEMDTLLSVAKSIKDDIEKSKVAAEKKLEEIGNQFTQVQEKIGQVQKAYEGFIVISTKITDPNNGLQAILDQSIELQKQSKETFSEIESFHEESKVHLEQIKKDEDETAQIKTKAEEDLDSINQNKTEIEKLTALITDTGLANSFQKREHLLRWSSLIWLGVFVLSILGLAGMLFNFFSKIQGVPEITIIIYRLTLTSPLLFLMGVAIKEYSNERSLNEKYAFKATIATVIRSHAEFLVQTHEQAGSENSSFIRTVLGSLYVEPYNKIYNSKHERDDFEVDFEGKDSKKKSKLFTVFSRAKELKELIPDDDTLKAVVELLLKFK